MQFIMHVSLCLSSISVSHLLLDESKAALCIVCEHDGLWELRQTHMGHEDPRECQVEWMMPLEIPSKAVTGAKHTSTHHDVAALLYYVFFPKSHLRSRMCVWGPFN